MKKNLRIFVYGTLQKGMSRNFAMGNPEKIEKAKLDGFEMYDCISYPTIIEGEGTVLGELYTYKNLVKFLKVLLSCDQIEGVSSKLFKRKKVPVNVNGKLKKAYVYICADKRMLVDKIELGIWKGK